MSKIEYKAVKNQNRAGRPPAGCVWEKDAEGNIVTNSKGEFGYRPATEADLKAQQAKKAGKGKRGRKAQAVPVAGEGSALTMKETYQSLSYAELEKAQTIVTRTMAKRKKQEVARLDKEMAKLAERKKALSK